MASLADNNGFISIAGRDYSGRATEFELKYKGDVIENTAGFNSTHKSRVIGLLDTELNFSISYDVTEFPNDILNLQPGTYAVILGPEGNASGKPKHAGSFVLSDTEGIKKTIAADQVIITGSMMGDGAPTTDITTGGTF